MKTATKYLALGALAALSLIQACEAGGAWEGTVRDSAGVAIVNNTATPLWGENDAWTVTEDLRIGTVAGEPEYQFGMIFSMAITGDGTIYVLDLQASEVRAFDAQGQYLRTIGGPGSGPGELSPQAAFVFDDPSGGLIVPDQGNLRVNRFDSSGEPTGSFPIKMDAGVPFRWMVDDAGRIIAQLRGLNVEGMAALEEGDPIVVYDTTGAVVDTVAVIPKGKMLEGITEGQAAIKIFAAEPIWDLDAEGSVYYAMNDQFRILVNTADGALTRIVKKAVEPKPVEESDKTAILRLMREQYEQFGVPPQAIEQIMQGVSFAEFYPEFGQMFVGPEKTIWVQRFRSAKDMAAASDEEVEFDPQAIGSPEWEIFDDQGRFMGVVTLPDRFRPVAIDGDHLFGVWQDELDVQYVMRLQVNRPVE